MSAVNMFCALHPILAQLIGAVIGTALGFMTTVTVLWLRYR